MVATRPGDAQPGSAPSGRHHRDVIAAAKGSGFLAGGSIFEFATRFVIAFVLARVLGVEDYGLYVLSISVAALFAGIAALGLDDAMVRYVAIMSGRDDAAGLRGTIQVGVGVSTVVGGLMGAILFAAAQPIADGLFDEPSLGPLLRLLAVIVPFLTLSNALVGTTRGFRRMDHAVLAENLIQSVVRMALLGILALVGRLDVYAAAIVFGVADVAASVTMIAFLNKRVPLKRPVSITVRRDVKEIFAFAIPLWLSGLLRQFRRNIEIILLGALSTVSSVGVFAVVNKINLVGHISLLSILIAVKPILAQLYDRKDRAGLAKVYTTTTRWTLALHMPLFVVMVLYPRPLLGFFGDEFSAGAAALVILAVAELVNAGTGICGPMLDMTGHTTVKLGNAILWTTLLLGSSALLIPRWGVMGAALAAFIAVSTVNVLCVVEVWVLERMTPYDRSSWKPLMAGAGALLVGVAASRVAPVVTVGAAALQAPIVVAVYAGLILLLGLAPEDRAVVSRALERVGWVARRVRVVSGKTAEKPGGA